MIALLIFVGGMLVGRVSRKLYRAVRYCPVCERTYPGHTLVQLERCERILEGWGGAGDEPVLPR